MTCIQASWMHTSVMDAYKRHGCIQASWMHTSVSRDGLGTNTFACGECTIAVLAVAPLHMHLPPHLATPHRPGRTLTWPTLQILPAPGPPTPGCPHLPPPPTPQHPPHLAEFVCHRDHHRKLRVAVVRRVIAHSRGHQHQRRRSGHSQWSIGT